MITRDTPVSGNLHLSPKLDVARMMQAETGVFWIYTVPLRNCPSKSMGCFQDHLHHWWPGANDAKTMISEKQVQNKMTLSNILGSITRVLDDPTSPYS